MLSVLAPGPPRRSAAALAARGSSRRRDQPLGGLSRRDAGGLPRRLCRGRALLRPGAGARPGERRPARPTRVVTRVALGDVAARPRRSPTGSRRPTRTTRWRRWCGSATRSPRATSPRRRRHARRGRATRVNPLLGGAARRLDRGRPRGLRRRPGEVRRDDRQRRARPPTASTTRRWRWPSPATSSRAEAILAGGEDGPLHLNRSSIVAHAEILAQIGREADAIAVIDEALAGGVPDAPLLDLRDRLAAGEEVPFDLVTRAARRRRRGVPHARRRAQHRRTRSGSRWCTPGSPRTSAPT